VSTAARPLDDGQARGDLGLGFAGAVVVHVSVFAALIFVRVSTPPMPPPIRMNLVAAQAGSPQMGAVQEEPKAEVPKAAPPKTVKTKPPETKTPAKKTPPPPPTKAATANVPDRETPPAPKAVAPTARGGPVGGKGTDTRTIETPGVEFNYPGYIDNITRVVDEKFGIDRRPTTATVQFTIRRDGTVDPETIKLYAASSIRDYNKKATGAIEAAARLKLFGKLPDGFPDDVLVVYFIFDGRK
jgi:hypothetical protein